MEIIRRVSWESSGKMGIAGLTRDELDQMDRMLLGASWVRVGDTRDWRAAMDRAVSFQRKSLSTGVDE